MDQESSFLTAAALAISGGFAWLKSGLNTTQKAQQALELHLAEHHMTKEDTEKFYVLMSAPTHLKIDNLSTQVKSVDDKLDKLLKEGD